MSESCEGTEHPKGLNRACIICGKELTGNQSKTCSIECRKKRKNERSLEYYWSNRDKILERMTEHYWENRMPRICVVCGKGLTGKQIKTCSDECRREQKKKYGIKYRQVNLEKLREQDHKKYLKNREKLLECQQKYYLNNRGEICEHDRRKYRISRGLPEDWDLSKESSIEVIMKRWLQESDIEFIQHHYINLENSTWTHVDFYIPEANVCLYCDGDYWHGPLKPDVQERDTKINRALEVKGYSVVRMTETEILEENRPWWLGELIPTEW